MIKNSLLALIFWCLTVGVNGQVPVLIPDSETMSLNGVWDFNYVSGIDSLSERFSDESGWQAIRVPGNWELQGFAEPHYGRELAEGTGYYRTSFTVPSSWQGKPIFLAFDGVLYGYECWMNGSFAGRYGNAFNRKVFDVSQLAKPGIRNTLYVKVRTRWKGWEFDTNDCWSLSGIYRDVTLFSLPDAHFNELRVQSRVQGRQADLAISVVMGSAKNGNLSLRASLYDNQNQLVKSALLTGNGSDYRTVLHLKNPSLWTAETPTLYTLKLEASRDGKLCQQLSRRIGIRELRWEDGVIRLNGTAIKLRGVNHHDLSPINGRAVTEKELLEDLHLMKAANVNFIRTSHYQPHPRFIELCDSMGFYVMEEVAFGYGDNHLYDKSYLPIILGRANDTYQRDKNSASVLFWSVGNENPLTRICLQTGDSLKKLDPTRPICFPQVGSYFRRIADSIPATADLLTPHYTAPSQLKDYAGRFDRPMIVTEYAHALGLDFDRMEALWEIMYAHPKLAGGAVWHFFDQGILRKSAVACNPDVPTAAVWLDSTTYYDNAGNQGADGLVYANRVPQVDYWQLRKVYAPIQVLDVSLKEQKHRVNLSLRLQNRYDFTNLNTIRCRWSLFADQKLVESGTKRLNAAPHDTAQLTLTFNRPDKGAVQYLKLAFLDNSGTCMTEKCIPLAENYADVLSDLSIGKPVKSAKSLTFGEYILSLDTLTGSLALTDRPGTELLKSGPFARMGRKTTLSELATTDKTPSNDPLLVNNSSKAGSQLWKPSLQASDFQVKQFTDDKLLLRYSFNRDSILEDRLDGTMEINVTNRGRLDFHYDWTPVKASGIALETGLSFLLPATLTEFRWVGLGPYPAYPGKDKLDEFGLFHLNSSDLNYQGNRMGVRLAVLTDSAGRGFVLYCDSAADIVIERTAKGLMLSHNAAVSGRFNKGSMPETKIKMDQVRSIKGSFSILPLGKDWPKSLREIVGDPTGKAAVLKPFYHSYDQ
jgi:beta-galactosidase